jgi:hypothetical protein
MFGAATRGSRSLSPRAGGRDGIHRSVESRGWRDTLRLRLSAQRTESRPPAPIFGYSISEVSGSRPGLVSGCVAVCS